MTDLPASEIVPFEEQEPPVVFVSDNKTPTLVLHNILEDLGLAGARIPAKELVDKTFTILRAKPFNSRFKGQAHAYFCVCGDTETGEMFSTVLGGMAIVELLDVYIQMGHVNPLTVTLRFVDQGAFNGYYTIE